MYYVCYYRYQNTPTNFWRKSPVNYFAEKFISLRVWCPKSKLLQSRYHFFIVHVLKYEKP
jgi:hypothetical protein